MKTRREFLKIGVLAGASAGAGLLAWKNQGLIRRAWAEGDLNPSTIPKYVTPLAIPAVMPKTSSGLIDYYEIAVRQFTQQILPAPQPPTRVWGYGSVNHSSTFSYPARTIEAQTNKTVRVKWINGLVTAGGNFRPHLLDVEQNLHWANPPGGIAGRDTRGNNTADYLGPVPTVTHLHGAHDNEESDGYPEAWYLPAAVNIPSSYARVGSYYDQFNAKAAAYLGAPWSPGTATFTYPNDQRATTLWYHDHTLGMTRQNIYTGLTGFYLLRGGASDLAAGVLPGAAYEIPIVIQDKSFDIGGSLVYAGDFENGFFGDFMVANGKTWPFLNVERHRYRFRFLNAANARHLRLKLVTGNPAVRPASAALPFWQIGSDGGFLPAPTMRQTLILGIAERADVIVDFTGVSPNTAVFLINEGVEQGDADETDTNPATTGQVMKFNVGATSADPSTPPNQLTLPTIQFPGTPSVTRDVTLTHHDHNGGEAMLLGTVTAGPLMWDDPITENPALNAVEVWRIHNFAEQVHPIHIHIVQFQVLSHTDKNGNVRGPEPGENGFKDTVNVLPDEVTAVKAKFDVPGLFVWHCHILEHEDKEMMRPYRTGPA